MGVIPGSRTWVPKYLDDRKTRPAKSQKRIEAEAQARAQKTAERVVAETLDPSDPSDRALRPTLPPRPEKPVRPGSRAARTAGRRDPMDPITAAQVAAFRIENEGKVDQGGLIEAILYCLPVPHDKQRLIEESPAKRKVINVGRRGGKTTLGARVAIMKMCEGRRVLLASTTQEQADAFWEKCKTWLAEFFESGEILKNETRRTLEMPSTKGRIRVKTASDADTLRGDYADFLVLDECALLAEDAWNKVGAPMLLDNDGDAWFLSTPRRRNWFFRLHVTAVADTTGRWAYFTFTSFDNPYLSQAALDEIMQDLTPEDFQQEIMAQFLEGEGAVFRNIAACMDAPPHPDPRDHQGHFVVLGGDWGMRTDYTAICVLCADCMQELFLDRFNRIEWALQRDRLINAWNMWYVRYGMVESNSIGSPNLEVLWNEDRLNIEGFDTNIKTKPQMIRGLALALERHDVSWINYPVATGELEAYEAKTSKITGHTQYSAPEGIHDDTVVARGIALYAALNGSKPAPDAATFRELAAATTERDDGWVVYDSGGPAYQSYGGTAANSLPGAESGYNPAIAIPPGRPF